MSLEKMIAATRSPVLSSFLPPLTLLRVVDRLLDREQGRAPKRLVAEFAEPGLQICDDAGIDRGDKFDCQTET